MIQRQRQQEMQSGRKTPRIRPQPQSPKRKNNKEPDRNKWRQIREIYVADTDIEAKNDILNGFAGEFWDTYFKPVIERIKIDVKLAGLRKN